MLSFIEFFFLLFLLLLIFIFIFSSSNRNFKKSWWRLKGILLRSLMCIKFTLYNYSAVCYTFYYLYQFLSEVEHQKTHKPSHQPLLSIPFTKKKKKNLYLFLLKNKQNQFFTFVHWKHVHWTHTNWSFHSRTTFARIILRIEDQTLKLRCTSDFSTIFSRFSKTMKANVSMIEH